MVEKPCFAANAVPVCPDRQIYQASIAGQQFAERVAHEFFIHFAGRYRRSSWHDAKRRQAGVQATSVVRTGEIFRGKRPAAKMVSGFRCRCISLRHHRRRLRHQIHSAQGDDTPTRRLPSNSRGRWARPRSRYIWMDEAVLEYSISASHRAPAAARSACVRRWSDRARRKRKWTARRVVTRRDCLSRDISMRFVMCSQLRRRLQSRRWRKRSPSTRTRSGPHRRAGPSP